MLGQLSEPQIPDGYIQVVIGRQPMMLDGDYDLNQHWLPFMDGFQYKIPRSSPVKQPLPAPHRNVHERIKHAYARIGESGRVMYQYKKGVPQICLPFKEFQKLSNKDHSKIQHAGYPGWERHDGKPLIVSFHNHHRNDIEQWCARNSRGRYHVNRANAFFELADDYLMVRMIYQKPKESQ